MMSLLALLEAMTSCHQWCASVQPKFHFSIMELWQNARVSPAAQWHHFLLWHCCIRTLLTGPQFLSCCSAAWSFDRCVCILILNWETGHLWFKYSDHLVIWSGFEGKLLRHIWQNVAGKENEHVVQLLTEVFNKGEVPTAVSVNS